MEKEGISFREELQSISNNARKNKTLTDEEYDETDGSMIWMSALIEDKLKKFATQGHHEMQINLFDFLEKSIVTFGHLVLPIGLVLKEDVEKRSLSTETC